MPTTTNRSLSVPATGADPGTWGTSDLNPNFAMLDTIVGGVAFISTTGGSVPLNAAQLACGTISISGALSAYVSVNFPAVQGWWSIENLTTGNFTVFIQPGSVTEQICIPPGEITDIQINGNVARFRNLGRVGSWLDYAGTTVPQWISNCTIPPYLNCDGSTFSSATYPYLASILGTTTLPDMRGTVRATLNQGTSRLTVVNGDARFSVGGNQLLQSHAHTGSGTTSGQSNDHIHGAAAGQYGVYAANFASGGSAALSPSGNANTVGVSADHSHTYSFTTSSIGSGNSQNVQPTTIGGITMIRAA